MKMEQRTRPQRTIIVEGPCQGSWSEEDRLNLSRLPMGGEVEDAWVFPAFFSRLSRPIDCRWMLALTRSGVSFGSSRQEIANRYVNAVAAAGGFESVEPDEELQAMHDAWLIWDARQWPRMELESRVLARHTCEEIAEAMQLSVDCVRLYEESFFDVRDRREASSFMCIAVLGGMDVGSPQRPLYDVIKRLAYGGGPVVLDYALRAARATPEELEGDDEETDLLRLARLKLIIDQVPMNRVTSPYHLQLRAERRRSQADWLNAALRLLDVAYGSVDLTDADIWPDLRQVYVEYGLREATQTEQNV